DRDAPAGEEPAVPPRPADAATLLPAGDPDRRPRVVALSHAALALRLRRHQERHPLTAGEPVLVALGPAAVEELLWPLTARATRVLAPPGGLRRPEAHVPLVREAGVTTLRLPATALRAFLAGPAAAACTGVRRVLCAGEALPSDLAARCRRLLPRAELHSVY